MFVFYTQGNNFYILQPSLTIRMPINKVKVIETIEFEKSIYEFRDDGILFITVKDNVHLELADSKEEYAMLLTKSEYLPLNVLIRAGKHSSTSKEVRDYANSKDARAIMNAQALVVESLAHKILANFIKNFYKVPVKLQIFNDDESALQWLKSQQ